MGRFERIKVFASYMALAFVFLCTISCTGETGAPAPTPAPVPTPTPPLAGYTVVLDPGHGGFDGGATGVDTGTPEAGINLAVSKLVKVQLEEQGCTVVLTRPDEEALGNDKQSDLRARREIMNAEGVDAVVSIHMNKFSDRTISGPMVFYMTGSSPGQALAECMVKEVCDAVGRNQRMANPGDYYVIRETLPPAVIVECGFLSNPEDERMLLTEEYQQKLATGIAKGVYEYFASQVTSP